MTDFSLLADLEAEQAVLGALLLDPHALGRVRDLVSIEDFCRENHGQIYRAALQLDGRGEPIDNVTLADEIGRLGVLEQVGGRARLAELEERTPTAANVEHYARIVSEWAERRRQVADEEKRHHRAMAALADPGLPLAASNGHVGRLLHEIQPEEVSWLWYGRIPLGTLTVLDGDPGLGKSTVTLDLAARVTTGAPMPDGTRGIQGGVVILTAEDSPGATVRPRFELHGGDATRVVVLESVGKGDSEHEVTLPGDLAAVRAAIDRVGARLVIVDPLMAYLASDVKANSDQDVRRVLRQLRTLAEETGVAVLVIRHLNKASGVSPIYRGGGSIGIIGAARSGLMIAKDPDNEDVRVLAVLKQNLAPEQPSLSYTLESHGAVARVTWQGQHAATAAQLLALPLTDEEKREGDEAGDFLFSLLDDDPEGAAVEAAEALKLWRRQGGVDRTLQRARKRLGWAVQREGFGKGSRVLWAAPASHRRHIGDIDDSTGDVSPMSSMVSPMVEGTCSATGNGTHPSGSPPGCPACGNPAFQAVEDGRRRCTGPRGCGQIYEAAQ
jgi:hypothetical protein